MTDKVNGSVVQGVWFSPGVNVFSLTVTDAGGAVAPTTFVADATTEVVSSRLESVLSVVSTRGTILGISVESDTVVHVMIDTSHAIEEVGIAAELQTAIAAVSADIQTAAIVVFDGFRGGSNS